MRKPILYLALVSGVLWAVSGALAGEPPWSDNFDKYAKGTKLHDVGGWRGWDGNPAFAGTVTDAQSKSPPHSFLSEGVVDGTQQFKTANKPIVYTATTQWYIPTNFQSGGTGANRGTYFIMLNKYVEGPTANNWSVQIHVDSDTRSIIRDDGGGPHTRPWITGRWVELKVVIDLGADKYDVYYDGTPLGPLGFKWTEGLSGRGQLDIQCIDLFANGSSPAYFDDVSLIPEPASVVLLGLGALALRRRR